MNFILNNFAYHRLFAEEKGLKNFFKRIFALRHRKHRRFRVQEGLTVVIDPGALPGDQVVNIGLGGLTFNWIDRGQPLSEKLRIDVFLNGKLYLEKVKAKLVSNIDMGDISYSSKNIRRISVQFLRLTPVQEFDLKALIRSNGFKEY